MWRRRAPRNPMGQSQMIIFDINKHVNADGYVIQKGRKVHKSTVAFVLIILECGLGQLHCTSATEFSLGDISGPGLWLDAMKLPERCQAGLCLSWLVDHGHVPLEKLTHRRGNTLLYRPKPNH